MEFRMFDMNQNKCLTEDEKENIAEDIQQTKCFDFPDTPIVNESLSAYTQLHYICGYIDLFDRYGQYIDKTRSDFEIMKGLPSNDRGKKHSLDSMTDVVDENAIVWLDNVIKIMLTKEFALYQQSSFTVSLQNEPASLSISESKRQELYDLLEDKFKRKKERKYILRVPNKNKYLTSAFAPFAHILLALKSKLKRTDAKKEVHSVYYWSTLSVDKISIDFSTYFTTSDYWYYEMETGVNLCVEIAGTLLDLLNQKAIKDTDVEGMCLAVRDCLCFLNSYPLLIRLHLIRNCIQYGAAYMQAARQHPSFYILADNTLKSPIKENMPRTFQTQISRTSMPKESNPQSDNQIIIKFEAEHLTWVFSEILHTTEIPFRPQASAGVVSDNEFEYIKNHFGIPKGFLITEDKHPKHALAFCNLSHPYIQEYINYVSPRPKSEKGSKFSKNYSLEEMFIRVHSLIIAAKEIVTPKD